MLMLIAISLVVVLADPEPSDELYSRFPKNREEDKCYDDNGKPQVCALFIIINSYCATSQATS